MLFCSTRSRRRSSSRGCTLAEVVVSIAIMALVLGGVINGYVMSSQRAEWNAYSLAAQSLASQGVEQARAAKWDPQAWPAVDEMAPANYIEVDTLDIPVSGQPQYATNFMSISMVSANPPLRQLRADCVWVFPSRGLFTNTVITLRAPDQ